MFLTSRHLSIPNGVNFKEDTIMSDKIQDLLNIKAVDTIRTHLRSPSKKNDPSCLSFVGVTNAKKNRKKSKLARVRNKAFWNVDPTGDYPIDNLIGQQYALDALQFMMWNNQAKGYLLTWAVRDMPKDEKLSGIEVGFLCSFAKFALQGATQKSIKEFMS